MYQGLKVFLLAAVLLLFLSAVSPLRADIMDMYCYLEAGNVDTYVEVWEEDRQGNKGPQIWQGIVKKGTRVKITNRFGTIRYSSTIYVGSKDALSGDQSRWCESAATIGVP